MPQVTKQLLIINAVFFLAKYTINFVSLDVMLSSYYPKSGNFHAYQILSHMFMHANFSHFFFNMFSLWMFGTAVEQTIGTKNYLFLYFFAGLGSFALFNGFQYYLAEQELNALAPYSDKVRNTLGKIHFNIKAPLEPQLNTLYRLFIEKLPKPLLIEKNDQSLQSIFMIFNSPMMGASGAIYGVLVAFGLLFPHAELMLLFFPMPLKAKYFVPILMLMSLFLGISQIKGDSVAHFAHLGGAIFGWFFIRYLIKKNKRSYRL